MPRSADGRWPAGTSAAGGADPIGAANETALTAGLVEVRRRRRRPPCSARSSRRSRSCSSADRDRPGHGDRWRRGADRCPPRSGRRSSCRRRRRQALRVGGREAHGDADDLARLERRRSDAHHRTVLQRGRRASPTPGGATEAVPFPGPNCRLKSKPPSAKPMTRRTATPTNRKTTPATTATTTAAPPPVPPVPLPQPPRP